MMQDIPEIADLTGARHGCKRRLDTGSNSDPLKASTGSNDSAWNDCTTGNGDSIQRATEESAEEKALREQREDEAEFGFTAKHHRRHYVQHNYCDHADDEDDSNDPKNDNSAQNSKRFSNGSGGGGVSIPFPEKLHLLLDKIEQDGFGHVISWQPHGRSFLVHEPKEFCQVIMPRYFRQSKLSSFQRQLNLYGFCRLTRGRDKNAYYHELFLRGRLFLTKRMTRTRIKGTGIKASSSPDTEPNFYHMSVCLPAATPTTPQHSQPCSQDAWQNPQQQQHQELQQQHQQVQAQVQVQDPGMVNNVALNPSWRDAIANGAQMSSAVQQQQQQQQQQQSLGNPPSQLIYQQAQVPQQVMQQVQIMGQHGMNSAGGNGGQTMYILQQAPVNGGDQPTQQPSWVQVQTVNAPLLQQQQQQHSHSPNQQQQQQQVLYALPLQGQIPPQPQPQHHQQQQQQQIHVNQPSGNQNASWSVVNTVPSPPSTVQDVPPQAAVPLHQQAASLFSALQMQTNHAISSPHMHLSPITARLLDPMLLQRFQQPQASNNDAAAAAAAAADSLGSSQVPAQHPSMQQMVASNVNRQVPIGITTRVVSDPTTNGDNNNKSNIETNGVPDRPDSRKSSPLPSDEKEVEILFNVGVDASKVKRKPELVQEPTERCGKSHRRVMSTSKTQVMDSNHDHHQNHNSNGDKPRAETPTGLSDSTPLDDDDEEEDDPDPAGVVAMDIGNGAASFRRRNEHNMSLALRRLSMVSLGSDISDGEAERRDAQAMDDFFAEFEDAETKALVEMVAEHDTDEVLGDMLDHMIDSL